MSYLVRTLARGVSVRDGATQLTRTAGASSAASDRAKPSTPPLTALTIEWFGKPCETHRGRCKREGQWEGLSMMGKGFRGLDV